MFVGLHVTLANVTQNPELALTKEEGDEFFAKAQNVLRHYSIEASQKAIDWIAFMGVAGTMYGTRAFAMFNRKHMERTARAARPRPQPEPSRDNVTPLRPAQPEPGAHSVPVTMAVVDEPIIPNAEEF